MPVKPPSRLFVVACVLGLACLGGTGLLARQAYEAHQAPVTLQRPHLLLGKILEKSPLELRIQGIGERAGYSYTVIYGAQTRFVRLAPWKDGERAQAQRVYEAYVAKLPADHQGLIIPPPSSMNVLHSGPDDLPVGTAVGIISNDVIPAAASTFIMADVVRPLLPDEASSGIVSVSFPFPQ